MNQQFSKCSLLIAKLVFIVNSIYSLNTFADPSLMPIDPLADVKAKAARNSTPVEAPAPAATGADASELSPNEMSRLTSDEAIGMDYSEDKIAEHATALKKEAFNNLSYLQSAALATNPQVKEAVTVATTNNKTFLDKLVAEVKACNESARTTAKICLESMDPGVQSAMGALSQLAPMMGMMSMNDTCSSFSKIMTMLNGAMAAYRIACATKKAATDSACGQAANTVRTLKENASKYKEAAEGPLLKLATTADATPPNNATLVNTKAVNNLAANQQRVINILDGLSNVSNRYTPAYGLKIAAGKGQLLANAGANALQVAGTLMSSQKCDKQTGAPTDQADLCKQYPSVCEKQSPTPIADYCVTNPNDITCVCSKNMNDPACSGSRSVDPTPGSSSGSVFNPADPSFSLDDSGSDLGPGFNPVGKDGLVDGGNGVNSFNGGGPDGGASGSYGSGSTDSSGSGSRGGVGNLGQFGSGSDSGRGSNGNRGSGVGSLGAGLGGSGNSGGPAGAAGNYGTGFNTDIAHDGGAGAAGGFGDGSRKPTAEELLKAFMPGGDKDPKKGQGLDGITAAGGLTIFQKVTRGYQRNTGSLIPE
jgi:hypothetical protein